MLVRKYDPNKQSDNFVFLKKDRMRIFKGIANTCEVVLEQNINGD